MAQPSPPSSSPPLPNAEAGADLADARLRAVVAAARYHGVEMDRAEFPRKATEAIPSPAALVDWIHDSGLWAKATRLRWRHLLRLSDGGPVVLLFTDGSAGLLTAGDPDRNIVWLKDPRAPETDPPVAVDELRLAQVWAGDVVLVRRARGEEVEDRPFSLGWLALMVLRQKSVLRSLAGASLAISFLTIIPMLMVMVVINQVVAHRAMSTLVVISLMLLLAVLFEAFLSYARRELLLVLAARIDTQLHLHVFNKMLNLPIDYFERNQAGSTAYKVSQIMMVRDFLTGRMMTTLLDMVTLAIMIPVLFLISPTLAWLVMAGSVLVALIIAAFLPTLRLLAAAVMGAESQKNSLMVETIYGIRTIKTLALENARKDLWDERVADAAHKRLESGHVANWATTLALPVERFVQMGVLLVGAYLMLTDPTAGVSVGALIAFMLLGQRVAAPLIGMAHLLEEYENVHAAVACVADVLNQKPESRGADQGMRPKFEGALSLDSVTFTYPLAKTPALEKLSFEIPAGTMLGVVGRSGSGKSTMARLLQGINREYSGSIKIDNIDLREINLRHLRRSFGVVLQDNFLFRGTVIENIHANRPGLTMEDVVRAARLAGAEEFIERLPRGYETWIEEGSVNLSGGQKQRLAIARALITDPRVLILDEATSALDPESEALVNANLLRIAKGRTMVIVSHRLSSLVECDAILVLDRGQIMDLAPHAVLVERCAVYRQLWLQQNRHMEVARGGNPVPALAPGDD